MSKTGKFSTHHVPDEGTWYQTGDTVRLEESARHIRIVKDPAGEYEVHACRHATEYGSDPPLLRVSLRRGPIPEWSDRP
ncbi:MAG: hypothetical protein IT306_30435 [Chloroflexi bacterium]|nr:hypothetical protein [Chloroflexota bacterium]